MEELAHISARLQRRETGAGGSAVERSRAAGAAEMAALWRWTAAQMGLG